MQDCKLRESRRSNPRGRMYTKPLKVAHGSGAHTGHRSWILSDWCWEIPCRVMPSLHTPLLKGKKYLYPWKIRRQIFKEGSVSGASAFQIHLKAVLGMSGCKRERNNRQQCSREIILESIRVLNADEPGTRLSLSMWLQFSGTLHARRVYILSWLL